MFSIRRSSLLCQATVYRFYYSRKSICSHLILTRVKVCHHTNSFQHATANTHNLSLSTSLTCHFALSLFLVAFTLLSLDENAAKKAFSKDQNKYFLFFHLASSIWIFGSMKHFFICLNFPSLLYYYSVTFSQTNFICSIKRSFHNLIFLEKIIAF